MVKHRSVEGCVWLLGRKSRVTPAPMKKVLWRKSTNIVDLRQEEMITSRWYNETIMNAV
jgi:hypothetical protein